MATLYGSDGRIYTLGQVLNEGGEGYVHEVPTEPHVVAKVWKRRRDPAAQKKLQRLRTLKLEILLNNPPRIARFLKTGFDLAWPTSALYDSKGAVVGYLMPRIPLSRYHEMVMFGNLAARRKLESALGKKFSRSDLLTMAGNTAHMVAHVHRKGYVIGDINDTNILISNDSRVVLIDIDSIQVPNPVTGEVLRCTVGKADFMAPRLIGVRFSEINRKVEDDLFALAVLIFQMVMNGCHPYDPLDRTSPGGDIRLQNVKKAHSPFAALDDVLANALLDLDSIPDQTLRARRKAEILARVGKRSAIDYSSLIEHRVSAWLALEPHFRDMFRRAFGQGVLGRPTATEWAIALKAAGARMPVIAVFGDTPIRLPSRLISPPPRPVTISATRTRMPSVPARQNTPSLPAGRSNVVPHKPVTSPPPVRVRKKKHKKKKRKSRRAQAWSLPTAFGAYSVAPVETSKVPKTKKRPKEKHRVPNQTTMGGPPLSRIDLSDASEEFGAGKELVWAVAIFLLLYFVVFRVGDCISMPDFARISSPPALLGASISPEQKSEPAGVEELAPCARLVAAADLSGCDLSGRNLTGYSLVSADLGSSDLSGANLKGGEFNGADLSGVSFTEANVKSTDSALADLTNAFFYESSRTDSAVFRSAVCSDAAVSSNCNTEGRLYRLNM